MSTFVNNDVSSGDVVLASDHNTQGALIAAVINGGIENENIKSGAAISTSKLADDAGITTAKLADGGVTLPKLLFTPTTQANAGTAGGTMTYMDLGGVKILWGLSSNTLADGTGGTNYTWTLPTSYFTTIQHVSSGVTKQNTVAGHIAPVDAFTTTTVTIKAQTLSGSGSHQHSILVIGT